MADKKRSEIGEEAVMWSGVILDRIAKGSHEGRRLYPGAEHEVSSGFD